jgi:hypothetical protein
MRGRDARLTAFAGPPQTPRNDDDPEATRL